MIGSSHNTMNGGAENLFHDHEHDSDMHELLNHLANSGEGEEDEFIYHHPYPGTFSNPNSNQTHSLEVRRFSTAVGMNPRMNADMINTTSIHEDLFAPVSNVHRPLISETSNNIQNKNEFQQLTGFITVDQVSTLQVLELSSKSEDELIDLNEVSLNSDT